MKSYVKRLVRCGYSYDRAFTVCKDFVKNLTIVDLECFVLSIEKNHVD